MKGVSKTLQKANENCGVLTVESWIENIQKINTNLITKLEKEFHKEDHLIPVPKIKRFGVSIDIKKKILKRDGYRCRKCGSTHHLQIHHIKLVMLGGKDNEENLITLCKSCHKIAPNTVYEFAKFIEIPLHIYAEHFLNGAESMFETIYGDPSLLDLKDKKFREKYPKLWWKEKRESLLKIAQKFYLESIC